MRNGRRRPDGFVAFGARTVHRSTSNTVRASITCTPVSTAGSAAPNGANTTGTISSSATPGIAGGLGRNLNAAADSGREADFASPMSRRRHPPNARLRRTPARCAASSAAPAPRGRGRREATRNGAGTAPPCGTVPPRPALRARRGDGASTRAASRAPPGREPFAPARRSGTTAAGNGSSIRYRLRLPERGSLPKGVSRRNRPISESAASGRDRLEAGDPRRPAISLTRWAPPPIASSRGRSAAAGGTSSRSNRSGSRCNGPAGSSTRVSTARSRGSGPRRAGRAARRPR